MRATHDATNLHPVGIRLHLVLILLCLLQIPHVHQSIWIEIIFSILLRLDCRHSIDSVLECVTYRWMANLCLIAPVRVHHRVVALSTS